jgi:hypothetical protein
MTEKDKEHTRILFAGFALCGAIMSRESWGPEKIWEIADNMIDSMEPQQTSGLPAIKRKQRVK